MGDPDWCILSEWITEIVQDLIVHPQQREDFTTLVRSLSHRYFRETRTTTPKHEYQLGVLACLHLVSCYVVSEPVPLAVLETICCHCYTRETIVRAVYTVMGWVSPPLWPDGLENVDYDRTFYTDHGTTCAMVRWGGRQLVRKRIGHDDRDLPAFHAVVEVMVHSRLAEKKSRNIARLLQVQVQDSCVDLYYEYIEDPLRLYRRRSRRQQQQVVIGLVRGLHCLHSLGIAHRDLKPDNLHVTADGYGVILDVGSAGLGKARHTNPICTITHRSPEMLQAEVDGVAMEYDGKCLDIWSLGVVILQLYGAWHPFGVASTTTTAAQMLQGIRSLVEVVLDAVVPLLSNEQGRLLRQCLREQPFERPGSLEMLRVFGSL